jgi:hypothetical protein
VQHTNEIVWFGIAQMYFKGMVTANNKKEQPSKKATSLNLDKEFLSINYMFE